MAKNIRATAMAFALMLGTIIGFGFNGGQALAAERDDVLATVTAYQEGLRAYDLDTMMGQFTADAVIMPQDGKPLVGIETIRSAYTRGVNALKFNMEHELKEVVSMSDEWAYVRTHGTGDLTILSSGTKLPQDLSEFFVLRKVAKEWKIASYIFNSTVRRGGK